MNEGKESWVERLQVRWKLKSGWQVFIVLVVFACTGFTVLFLKKPIFKLIHASDEYYTMLTIAYYILILPIYNVILLFYGFIFGQLPFFWEFEKRMFRRIRGEKADRQ